MTSRTVTFAALPLLPAILTPVQAETGVDDTSVRLDKVQQVANQIGSITEVRKRTAGEGILDTNRQHRFTKP